MNGPTTGGAAAFGDLVYADADLLRIEFEAIVAANFPDRATGRTDRREPAAPVLVGTARGPHRDDGPSGPRPPVPRATTGVPLRRQARQRGPPREHRHRDDGPRRRSPSRRRGRPRSAT
ncbi:hypothetical protein I4I73_10825 [Pseudonocardia sp. KRD-184]|uniref:Uncharacterized protein n=1 Tax=Pseudonocardia oceani TaxID=2792013 RepID=A0ABS6UAP2_9PSEU|nr:hypothetical protein [Pseudonocardia oceani]MBW0096481.1 hypothetical protein [Pseudonocardia oceani]MBW0129302.1 hypothetical protein [Pseudonocardia oceani]